MRFSSSSLPSLVSGDELDWRGGGLDEASIIVISYSNV
jgi:hypothetical protein